jgi:uncharacterized membrane protein HdeD (DUF308 family)
MTSAQLPGRFSADKVRGGWRGLLWVGVALVVLGIAAIVFPIASTLAATLMVGWMILLYGVIGLAGSFSIHGIGPFFGALLVPLLSVAAGIFMLFNPVAGAVALTLLVAGLFSIQGAFEISFAFEMRPHVGWVGLLISGIVSIAAAIFIVAAWPGISLVLVGILVGVNFASTGVAYVLLSRALKTVG